MAPFHLDAATFESFGATAYAAIERDGQQYGNWSRGDGKATYCYANSTQ